MTTKKLINTVIYSKDRAMQLDLLLRTYVDHNKSCAENEDNITVIYKATNEEFAKGYNELAAFYAILPEIKFVKESDFRQDTLNAINVEYKYTMFLMDDIIVYNKFSFEDEPFKLLEKYPDGILAVSLRLSSKTNYCYPISRNQTIPSFHKNCAWKWTEGDADFGYPMSLDGNVFHTSKILEILAQIPSERFTHPNTLEGALNDYAQARKSSGTIPQVMVCYPEASRLFNNPCNRVQNVVENKNENSLDPARLNEMFLSGKIINIDSTLEDIQSGKVIVNAAHFPIEVVIK